jgi:hypothetical protein
VKRVFSPLDEELALLPGALTPSLQEDVVRLGTWMPFQRVVGELQYFRRTDISKSSAVRLAEKAGAAYEAVQTAEVERIERALPEPPAGPERQFLSVDGAMVPVVGGAWMEVKTMVLGAVLPPRLVKGEPVIQTTDHSYFSRLAESSQFERLALVETQRRGVETAGAVAAVTDGAEWIQKFIDYHRGDAVRILDFPHAAEYVSDIAQALWGEQTELQTQWWEAQLHQLKQEGAAAVLATWRQEMDPQAETPELATALAYLEKRVGQMDYPAFQAAGWPIGDGAVESANKLVVEARLKGSGMHWAPGHVNPLLALRNIACNDRWEEAWPEITAHLRQQARQGSARRRQQRNARAAIPPLPPSTPADPPAPSSPPPTPPPAALAETPHTPSSRPPWRPAADHPWRRMPIGRARLN